MRRIKFLVIGLIYGIGGAAVTAYAALKPEIFEAPGGSYIAMGLGVLALIAGICSLSVYSRWN